MQYVGFWPLSTQVLAGSALPRPERIHPALSEAADPWVDQAVRGFRSLRQQHRNRLQRGGYDPEQAEVTVSRWRHWLHHHLALSGHEVDALQQQVLASGRLQLDRVRCHVQEGTGQPLPEPEAADELLWSGQSGGDFVHWLETGVAP